MNKDDYQYFNEIVGKIHSRINEILEIFSKLDKKVEVHNVKIKRIENGQKLRTTSWRDFFIKLFAILTAGIIFYFIGIKK